jgi:hypothetical protein
MNRSLIVGLLALPGALIAGYFAAAFAAFSAQGAADAWDRAGWLIWGILGGACWGTIPGIIMGLCTRVRWVFPLLSGALGALYAPTSALRSLTSADGDDSGAIWFATGGAVCVGIALGFLCWGAFALQDRRRRVSTEMSARRGA